MAAGEKKGVRRASTQGIRDPDFDHVKEEVVTPNSKGSAEFLTHSPETRSQLPDSATESAEEPISDSALQSTLPYYINIQI